MMSQLYTELFLKIWTAIKFKKSLFLGCLVKSRRKDTFIGHIAGRWLDSLASIQDCLSLYWQKAGSSAVFHRPREVEPNGRILTLLDPRWPGKASPLGSSWWPFLIARASSTYIHWTSGQMVNKENFVEILRQFDKRFLSQKPELFHAGQRHWHLDHAPICNSIMVTDYLAEMNMKTVSHSSYRPGLTPCGLWLDTKVKENVGDSFFQNNQQIEGGWDVGSWIPSLLRTSMDPPWSGAGVLRSVKRSQRILLWRRLHLWKW